MRTKTLQGDNASYDQCINELESKVKLLKTFIDNTEAGIYVNDYYTGEILYANRKVVTISGKQFNSEQLIGSTCWKLINKEGEGRCPFCPYEKLMGDNVRFTQPYIWEHFFAQFGFWFKIISQTITWVDGRIAQMNTFFDITEAKRMQEQLAEFAREKEYQRMQQNLQIVLDVLPVPVRIVDLESSTIIYGNKAALDLFKIDSYDDVIGKSVFAFMPELQSEGIRTVDLVKEQNGGKAASGEFICTKQDGEMFDLRITACVIDFNGKKASLGIMEDLTREKEQKRMLLSVAEKEREANQLKSNFLCNMSHEVRTPMNAIIGLTEIELNKKLPKESREIYRKINISAKNLLQIVNDILDLSKIEANKMELYPDEFELMNVLDNALLVVSPYLKGKQVELLIDVSKDLPPLIIGDKTRLWQILRNFLDNAVKFTIEGYVKLKVWVDKTQSTDNTIFLSFLITDTGIGMNEEQIQKIFLPYEQFYSDLQKRYTGTGLGMPISNRLCELMGGNLEVESESGIGTSIRFTLPFLRSRNKENQNKEVPFDLNVRFTDCRVLVCEDNEINQEVAVGMLEQFGITAIAAGDGKQGVELLETDGSFDLILMDLHMPVMDGIEATHIIRSNSAFDSIPIVTLTADAMSEVVERCMAAGMNDYLSKPFELNDFLKILLRWIPESKHR